MRLATTCFLACGLTTIASAAPLFRVSGNCFNQVSDSTSVSQALTSCSNPGVHVTSEQAESAEGGILRAYGTTTLDQNFVLPQFNLFANAFAYFSDSEMSVVGASGTGSVVMQMLVHGTGTARSRVYFNANLASQNDSDSALLNPQEIYNGTDGPFTVNNLYELRLDNFDFSQFFSLWAQLNAETIFRPGDTNMTATVNALNTASILGFGIYDSQGAPISGAFVMSGGYAFNDLNATAAPEPSAIVLSCGGVMALALLRRRKR